MMDLENSGNRFDQLLTSSEQRRTIVATQRIRTFRVSCHPRAVEHLDPLDDDGLLMFLPPGQCCRGLGGLYRRKEFCERWYRHAWNDGRRGLVVCRRSALRQQQDMRGSGNQIRMY